MKKYLLTLPFLFLATLLMGAKGIDQIEMGGELTLFKDTTAALNARTRKEGTIYYDNTTNQVKFDDGSVLAALTSGGGSSFVDSAFEILGSGDATKKLMFEVDGIATATTRTVTMPNANVNLTDVNNAVLVDGTRPFTANQSFGGFKATSLGAPTLGGDATNKTYVDAGDTGDIRADGSVPFTAAQSMGSFKLTSLAFGTSAADAVNRDQIVGRDSGAGSFSASSQKIIDVADPTLAQDAATKFYVDAADATFANKTLSNLTSPTAINEVLRGQDGTAAIPAYSFISDTNTGAYRSGADVFDVATNGINRLSIGTTNTTSANNILPSTHVSKNIGSTTLGWSEAHIADIYGPEFYGLRLFGRDATGANDADFVQMIGGASVDGLSGRVDVSSGNASGTGNSAQATVSTGSVNSGDSGQNRRLTGQSTSGDSGDILDETGTAPGGTRGSILHRALQTRLMDGTSTLPALSFETDTDLGLYRVSSNFLGVASGGAVRATFTDTKITTTVPLQVTSGTTAAPSLSFSAQPTVGMSAASANVLDFSTDAVLRFSIAITNSSMSTNFNPGVHATYDMGTDALQWNNGYFQSYLTAGPTMFVSRNGDLTTRATFSAAATSPSGVAVTSWNLNDQARVFAVTTSSNATANATATPDILIEPGNKTAGTGNGGSVKIRPGASSGGTRGMLELVNSSEIKIAHISATDRRIFQETVNTTDATFTTILTIPTTSGHQYTIHWSIIGRQTGGGVGSVGDSATYRIVSTAKNVGGTLTILDTNFTLYSFEQVLAPGFTAVASGTNILLQVQGQASKNVTWTVTAEMDTN